MWTINHSIYVLFVFIIFNPNAIACSASKMPSYISAPPNCNFSLLFSLSFFSFCYWISIFFWKYIPLQAKWFKNAVVLTWSANVAMVPVFILCYCSVSFILAGCFSVLLMFSLPIHTRRCTLTQANTQHLQEWLDLK